MNKSEKLKLVFDFIADYLSESEEEFVLNNNTNEETSGDGNMKRAYTIMKKVDEIDKVNAKVNKAVAPYKEELRKLNEEGNKNAIIEKMVLDETDDESVGVTFDENADLIKVNVKELNKNN